MVSRYAFEKTVCESATASETHITLSDTRGVRYQTVAPMGHVFVPEVPQLFPVTAVRHSALSRWRAWDQSGWTENLDLLL